jgi:hypothetical protein
VSRTERLRERNAELTAVSKIKEIGDKSHAVPYWNLMIRPQAARLKSEEHLPNYCSGSDFAAY